MIAAARFGRRKRRLHGEAGVALIEFAVTLPIMVVLVVGIFDFGSAFNLKQKLTAAAEIGARFAATLPTDDLSSGGTPNSVLAVRNVIDDYLTAQGVNDCNLLRATAGPPTNMSWTFAANGNGCPATFDLKIERSYVPSQGPGATYPVFTRIGISYPYSFSFGNVSGLLPNNPRFNGAHQLGTDAIEPNMD